MGLSILIADPHSSVDDELSKYLASHEYSIENAMTGKDAQLKAYKTKFFAAILDFDLQNNTALEVFKYLKINHPSTKIIFTLSSSEKLNEYSITREDLLKLGVQDLLTKPFNVEEIEKLLKGDLQFEIFKNSQNKEEVRSEEELVDIKDDEFTKVKIEYFFSGSHTIFDVYIKIGDNRYLKILHKGDTFSTEQIKRYRETHQVEYLFFQTKDRIYYIHYLNSLIEKALSVKGVSVDKKIKAVKSTTEQFVEEIYHEGLRPQMIEEGNKLCKNIFEMVSKEKGLSKIIAELKEINPSTYSHSFLVVFFSSMITSQMGWDNERTMQKIALGSMLHDIGKLKLDPVIQQLRPQEMTPDQFSQYVLHPQYGLDMVEKFSLVTTEVQQIIKQHHETMDGTGFPEKCSGVKIYPLAQVVGFADTISMIMAERGEKPLGAVREFLIDKENISKYNQQVIKSFLKCFLKDKIQMD